MGEKIQVWPIDNGLFTSRLPHVIQNDNFSQLINAYQWRGRALRKRGTSPLTRLTYVINNLSIGVPVSGVSFNLFTLAGFSFPSESIVVGGSNFLITVDGVTWTDQGNGNLKPSVGNSPATIDYATGDVTLSFLGVAPLSTATFSFYPTLPVMGLEDLFLTPNSGLGTIGFDTKYSYNISTTDPYNSYNVNFYANPATATYTNYTQKGTDTTTSWNGQNYQQFWSTNYLGAFWATNGVQVPFSSSNVGMQFNTIASFMILTSGIFGANPATANVTFNNSIAMLVIGDFLFFNEVIGIVGVNWQTGYITAISGSTITVTFPNASLSGAYITGSGIAQYLTNRSDATKDVLRYYTGDPTTSNNGWVNFAPPLNFFKLFQFVGFGLPPGIYYLVGAKIIIPFKDRLLFFGPIVQSSGLNGTSSTPMYLQDTVFCSQVGTPFYTVSYAQKFDVTTGLPLANTGPDNPVNPENIYFPILTPSGVGATPNSFFTDVNGFGYGRSSSLSQPITSVAPNEDSLIIGYYSNFQQQFVATGIGTDPFNFYTINSELGTSSTFSAVIMDEGVISKSTRGFIITSRTTVNRIDLQILDQIFQVNVVASQNGNERVCAQRDYINEWIYFTYLTNQETTSYPFPSQTLLLNYRDNSWAIFNESYTTYGLFREATGNYTWATLPSELTWATWNTPWNAGSSTTGQPLVIAGNAQGFVVIRDSSTTDEAPSIAIQSFSGATVTSPNHQLNNGDYIIISGCIGTLAPFMNNQLFSVGSTTQNTFLLDPDPLIPNGSTYLGGGVIQRLYVPFIQTRQFPTAWGMARKTRLGNQQYLFKRTPLGQISLYIYLSQDASQPYNLQFYPDDQSFNDAIIYSTVLFTCPESYNLGLTPYTTNLMTPTANTQNLIWHRMNTSLLGDTVQLGFTLSDAQMRLLTPTGQANATITGATNASPCVLSVSGSYPGSYQLGTLLQIQGVSGITQLNGNTYYVLSSTSNSVTINVDSTLFGLYITSLGTATPVFTTNCTEEIEMHGFIIDVNPSQLLV